MLDKRYNLYHLQRKVRIQWLSVLVIIIALTYISQPVQTPVSPCPESGCVSAVIPTVHAVEPIKQPQTIEEKIRVMFPEDPDRAVEIARCESGLRPNAINRKNRNGSVDVGLMQINSVHGYSESYLLDPDNNLRAARKLYDRQGFRPWVCASK